MESVTFPSMGILITVGPANPKMFDCVNMIVIPLVTVVNACSIPHMEEIIIILIYQICIHTKIYKLFFLYSSTTFNWIFGSLVTSYLLCLSR